MSLEFIVGRSKSGKSEYIYKEIAKLASEGKEVMLIVPEQFSYTAEKHILQYVDAIKDNSIEVFSFEHLAFVTEARLGFSAVPRINSVGKALIIRDILKKSTLDFYKGAGEQNGFVDLVTTSVSEFKKYMIFPETLGEIVSRTDDEVLTMKLRDLEKIYSQYEERIAGQQRDGDDVLLSLATYLGDNDIYNSKYVFFDGFSTFVPQELAIIGVMCRKCRHVCIALTGDSKESNTTLFMPTTDTIRKIKSVYNGEVKFTTMENGHFKSPELKFLEKHLYSFPSRSYDSACENIKVYGLQNPLSEARICALNIKKLIRESGYKFSDIGVVCSDIDSYARHIERAFDDAEIEYFIDNKTDIINHHLISFILGILEVYTEDYSFSAVFSYLKACFIDADPSALSLLERFISRSRVRRSTWLDSDKWNSVLEANFPEDEKIRKSINYIRDKYILPLARMHEEIKGRNSVRNNATVLYRFVSNLDMPEIIGAYIQKFSDAGEVRLAKEYEKIWDIIVETLDELVRLFGDSKVSPKEFYDLLETAFSQHKVGYIPTSVDRVLVGNTERTRFEDIEILFVLGVNEGVFPVTPKADGVLADSDKNAMKLCGVEYSTTTEIAAYYAQFAAYSAFTMPLEKLIVSYSKADNNFKTLRKSHIVERIRKIFSLDEISEVSVKELDMLVSNKVAKGILSDKVAQYSSGRSIDSLWKSVYDFFQSSDGFTDKLNYFLKSDNLVRSFSEKNLKELVPLLSYTSVSKIERYMACKYAYFIDYILRIDIPKEEAVDAIDIGNITHSILERLCKEFGESRESYINVSRDAVLARIDDYIDEFADEIFKGTDEVSPRDVYALQRLKNSIFMCFEIVREQFVESQFEPLGYEIEFNAESPVGPIEFETESGRRVVLTGKIDRADIFNAGDKSYIRVYDYKTGYKEFKLDDVLYGLSIQLLVYLNKLVDSNEGYKHGGAFYFPVSEAMVKKQGHTESSELEKDIKALFKPKGIVPFDDKLLDGYDPTIAVSARRPQSKHIYPEGFEIIHKYLKFKLGKICDDMINGNFEISPYKKSNFSPCEYCKLSSVCRFDTNNPDNCHIVYRAVSDYDTILNEMEAQSDVSKK